MQIPVRLLVEELSVSSSKRLCAIRGLPTGGTQSDRVSALSRSFGGRHEELFAALTREDLVRVLSPSWRTDAGIEFQFTYLSQARREVLMELAAQLSTSEWEPAEDGEVPIATSNITVMVLSGDEAEGDFENDDFPVDDDQDDQDREDDDEDERERERDFTAESYAVELEAEFKYLPEHKGETRRYQQDAVASLLAAIREPEPQLLHVATGGGKTRIANDVVTRFLESGGGRVLWVTKDWRLLWQAARDRSRRTPEGFEQISRLGGNRTVLHPLSEQTGCDVVYTTLQTLGRRLSTLSRRDRPALVVWDECHWGEHARLGRRLLAWCKRHRIAVMGLTATPRAPADSRFRNAYSIDYLTLVRQGYLAEAQPIDPVRTGTNWDPRRPNTFSDFQQGSLSELGRNAKRNRLIVEHYKANVARYQQTIVFACSIEHADALAVMFNSDYGIAARPVHSARTNVENDDTLRGFDRAEIHVLVNVAKLTMGYDFPEARTIFLCRPTLSEILFAQMIGRAARLHHRSGKKHFYVVEFTDNLAKFGDQLVTAKSYFKGALTTSVTSPRPPESPRQSRAREHAFDAHGAATWLPGDAAVPEAARGLWYREGQTFGVEVELTSDDFDPEMSEGAWLPRAEALRDDLARHLGADRVAPRPMAHNGTNGSDHSVWNVKWDGSAGWEVTSRILSGKDGYLELDQACGALTRSSERLGLRVNARTGLHVHLGWLGRSVKEVKRAIALARVFEPGLGTIVSPSRIARFDGHQYDTTRANQYCRPVSAAIPLDELEGVGSFSDLWTLTSDHDVRYVTFNVKPLGSIQTVEVRLFNGTTDAEKILLWLSLWQQILWAAANDTAVEEVPDCKVISPSGDIIALATRYLPADRGRVLARLHERRLEVRGLWEDRAELSEWVRWSAAWTAPETPPPAAGPVLPPALYFAYGANMAPDVILARCPSARALGIATLVGHRLAFGGRSTRWGGSVATVVAKEGGRVSGVLYEIPAEELASLDDAEGGRYERREVTVDAAGTEKAAHLYSMVGAVSAGAPSAEYLRVLRAEYQRNGFDVVGLLDAITG